MPSDPDFKRAVEEVKRRLAIEDVVREWVPDLKKAGRLWQACCPFHDEKTPSFKVDPTKQTWRCYGACGDGGDVISFTMKRQNVEFMDALELLAAQAGVEVPRASRDGRGRRGDDDPGMAALASADSYFQACLQTSEGRSAREYLASRGLGANTIAAFGLGWAPLNGQDLVRHAQQEPSGATGARTKDLDPWMQSGMLRRGDDGGIYSFFRGRLTIPIRDRKGRTVGFGARRLTDGEKAGPKYVNTPETPYFRKGELIYALDRAIDSVRRGWHLILVEGYTDVMAAHQVGLSHVCAVLGTSTTLDHAALVRSSGARRVTLFFDGDDAGRKAAWRALDGLLPLDLDLDVAVLPAGKDPADLCADGAEAFNAQLEHAQDWFDFVCDGLTDLPGKQKAKAVDDVLRLLGRLAKPVHGASLQAQLAERLGMDPITIQSAWNALRENRRDPAYDIPRPPQGVPPSEGQKGTKKRVDGRVLAAYKAAVGAVLLDSVLVPRIRLLFERCPNVGLRSVIGAILELYEDEDALIDESSVMTQLGADPVRNHVSSLVAYASQANLSPLDLLNESLQTLTQIELRDEIDGLRTRSLDPETPEEERREAILELTHKTRELSDSSNAHSLSAYLSQPPA